MKAPSVRGSGEADESSSRPGSGASMPGAAPISGKARRAWPHCASAAGSGGAA